MNSANRDSHGDPPPPTRSKTAGRSRRTAPANRTIVGTSYSAFNDPLSSSRTGSGSATGRGDTANRDSLALDLIEPVSGVHRPRTRDDRRTLTGVQYNIFDSERYVLTLDDHRMRDIASSAPYDFLEILVNEKTYGGGGIFNDQATSCVDSA